MEEVMASLLVNIAFERKVKLLTVILLPRKVMNIENLGVFHNLLMIS